MAAQNPGLHRHAILKMLTTAAAIYENTPDQMLSHKRDFNILFGSEFDLYSQFPFCSIHEKTLATLSIGYTRGKPSCRSILIPFY